MKLNKRGLLIVISGPSGVGKGEVTRALFRTPENNFFYSISMTTRNPREGEIDGKDYYFVTKDYFEEQIRNNNLLEYAQFVENYYGTPLSTIEEKLNQGLEVIIECEVDGALQIKEKMKDAILIFLAPPCRDTLYERLLKRGTEDQYQLEKRIQKAKSEFEVAHKYNYIVVNDEVESAVHKVTSIIIAEHSKTERSIHTYTKLIKECEEKQNGN